MLLDRLLADHSVLGDAQQGFICGPEVNAKIWHMHKYAICTVYTRDLAGVWRLKVHPHYNPNFNPDSRDRLKLDSSHINCGR